MIEGTTPLGLVLGSGPIEGTGDPSSLGPGLGEGVAVAVAVSLGLPHTV
jgi:hypothetical protein